MIFVCWSPKGGSGASTVIAQVAKYIHKPTIIADFNYLEPSLALYLELPVRACNMSDTLRRIRAHEKPKLHKVSDFVDIVSAEDILYLRNYTSYDVEDFLVFAKERYTNILLDVPSPFNDAVTLRAIQMSDVCCVVCNRTPVSVAVTSKAITLLERMKVNSSIALLVSPIGHVSISEIYEHMKKKPFELPQVGKKGWDKVAQIFG